VEAGELLIVQMRFGNLDSGPKTLAPWFNTAVFAGHTIGTYGNERPETNVVNHPNFDGHTIALGKSKFGQITSANINIERDIQFGLNLLF
jgi:hypothetical protein